MDRRAAGPDAEHSARPGRALPRAAPPRGRPVVPVGAQAIQTRITTLPILSARAKYSIAALASSNA
jgi:hypothetical protein